MLEHPTDAIEPMAAAPIFAPALVFRHYPSIPCNTDHWNNLYEKHIIIEGTIDSFKEALTTVAKEFSDGEALKVDLSLAGIVQLTAFSRRRALRAGTAQERP